MPNRNFHWRAKCPRDHRRCSPHASDVVHICLSARMAQKLFKLFSRDNSGSFRVQMPGPVLRPSFKPWAEVVDQIVAEEAHTPRRLQTTAVRIFKKLREEHGYTGCYNVAQEYVHQARVAADPNYRTRRRSKAKSSKKKQHRTAKPETRSGEASQAERSKREPRDRTAYLRSLHPRPVFMPEDFAYDWMHSIEQRATNLEAIEEQIPELQHAELKTLLTSARNGPSSNRNRSLAMLAYFRGISPSHIASFLKIGLSTVFYFARVFRNGGTSDLLTRKPRSDKKTNNDSIKSAIFSLLHSPPSAHSINRTTWRLDDLRRVLKEESDVSISRDLISIIIREAGWKWRHARIVLTSNDPEYRTKLEAIKKILSQLEPNEAFFSIDEYGPFAIKRKGGEKRVAPGEQYVIPQWQKSKGWLILTAAIELSRNRITHFFSRKKNTAEMIKMADLLRENYRGFKTLYLSWDAASWHISKDLNSHLNSLNQKAETKGFPVIKLAPLPAGAQFLNVIESIFSGMARAIIHNSDYPSPEAAMEAIDCYFKQRNEYFATHPSKAGNKIWGMERVPSHFAEDQNCKDPAYQSY